MNLLRLLLTSLLCVSILSCRLSYDKVRGDINSENLTTDTGINLNIKMCIEGAFVSSSPLLMKNSLNIQDRISLQSPYDSSVTTQNLLDLDVFVDWVNIKLFLWNGASYIYEGSQSALLHQNGSIYDIYGIEGLNFPVSPVGNYIIQVIHRNHLSLSNKNSVTLNLDFTSGVYNVDFTDPGLALMDDNGAFPSINMAGTSCLRAGDLNQDLSIDATDLQILENEILTHVSNPNHNTELIGLFLGDVNFDGKISNFSDILGTVPSQDRSLIMSNSGTVGSSL